MGEETAMTTDMYCAFSMIHDGNGRAAGASGLTLARIAPGGSACLTPRRGGPWRASIWACRPPVTQTSC